MSKHNYLGELLGAIAPLRQRNCIALQRAQSVSDLDSVTADNIEVGVTGARVKRATIRLAFIACAKTMLFIAIATSLM